MTALTRLSKLNILILKITMELTDFYAAPQLVELLELAKSSNDLLDLLSPHENQHSDILAWCFNAKEGHGQGDTILKDFLLAIFRAATNSEPGDKVHGKGLSRDFVRAWTPARIMTSSFATAISYREYTLPQEKGDSVKRRLDLLVVDPDNQLIIVIENKAGTGFHTGQLQGYLEGVQKTLLSRQVFKNFQVVFVAMDRNHDMDSESDEDDNVDGRWVRLSYDWLRPASKRAEVAVKRGNQSASLLLTYCRAQTGWESEEMGAMTRLARDIAILFPAVIAEIKRVSNELYHPETWTPQLLRPDSVEGQLLKLCLQNQDAISWLVDLSPLQLLHARLAEHLPVLDQPDQSADLYEYGRVWSNYQLPMDQSLPKIDDQWPLFLRVRHIDSESKGQPQFRIELVWRPYGVPEDDRERVCTALSTAFPAAKGSVNRKNALKLNKSVHDSFDSAESALKSIIEKVHRAFSTVIR